MTRNIQQLEDIKLLVDAFHAKIEKDDLLRSIFKNNSKEERTKQVKKMYHFWQSILLDTNYGYVCPFHDNFTMERQYFVRWIELFYKTLDENFEGELVNEAKWIAAKLAQNKTFHNRNVEEALYSF
ncbi:hypothetical protein BWZ22_15610 [Seonamhaeicola sp. S2-3]|uniref:truncated hemoglobin n=1 Tax=Seonamhaeicola sp. S2-3 TaxID=1936081 RepID=UPI0009727B87|nr:group III truncated hemoglobin [Seonamhaeicola sp. S2-3]APY12556.1 hypothetical protein BWZ22_15610 [Seonamhaeicola sp. S2-3]